MPAERKGRKGKGRKGKGSGASTPPLPFSPSPLLLFLPFLHKNSPPEHQHRPREQRGQGDRPQGLPPGHDRPEAHGQPGGGEQGHRRAERPSCPGVGRGDHQQTKIGRSQARGEDRRPRPGHDEGRDVIVERLAAVADGEIDVACAVDDRPRRQAVVGLVVGHARRDRRQRHQPERGRRQHNQQNQRCSMKFGRRDRNSRRCNRSHANG